MKYEDGMADYYASFFDALISEVSVDDQVYHGQLRVSANLKTFMDPESVKEVMLSLKVKTRKSLTLYPK